MPCTVLQLKQFFVHPVGSDFSCFVGVPNLAGILIHDDEQVKHTSGVDSQSLNIDINVHGTSGLLAFLLSHFLVTHINLHL